MLKFSWRSQGVAREDEEQHPPAPARAPSPSTSTDTAILATLKAMEARIITMEKKRGGGGRGANGRDSVDHVINPNATKCRHCGRVHIRPDYECWDLESNAYRCPENWKNPKKE